MFDVSDCLDGSDTEFMRAGISIKLGWCKFGHDPVDVSQLGFLQIPRLGKVIFDFIVLHFFLVAITVKDFMKLVIVLMVGCFTLC